jgi:CheY-like chemotaxis protein
MKPSILIVEDHTMIAEYLASVLAAAGFEAVQAGSLAQARELVASRRFDAWLCDRHLPDGEATALLRERGGSSEPATPAIALTAELDPATRQRLLEAGFVDALQKPCTPQALQQALRGVLAQQPNDSAGPGDDPTGPPSMPVLDDDAALRMCGGDRPALAAMRRLLLAELAPLQAQLSALEEGAADITRLSGELHRLAASAAWCGASEAGARGAALRGALDDPARRGAAARALAAALERLIEALQPQTA